MAVHDVYHLMTVAQAAARRAGDILLGQRDKYAHITTASAHDIKIEMDKVSEAFIIKELQSVSTFPILAEESGHQGGALDGFHWIIDPLDGTINYFRGIPFCCISIGLWDGNTPVAGVVYDPYRREMFWGIANKGAWLNDQPIRVSDTATTASAIMATGFPSKLDLSADVFERLSHYIKSYQKLRWFGSAALSLVYVAAGRVDVYKERCIMRWDIAGALPILIGAGGVFHLNATEVMHCLHIDASNGKVPVL